MPQVACSMHRSPGSLPGGACGIFLPVSGKLRPARAILILAERSPGSIYRMLWFPEAPPGASGSRIVDFEDLFQRFGQPGVVRCRKLALGEDRGDLFEALPGLGVELKLAQTQLVAPEEARSGDKVILVQDGLEVTSQRLEVPRAKFPLVPDLLNLFKL